MKRDLGPRVEVVDAAAPRLEPPPQESLPALVLGQEPDDGGAGTGGLLLAGTDPTGYGGVVAGYSNARELELLVEEGLTPLEAIRVATLNGATYLGRADRVGTVQAGKQADLVVVRGDPSTRIADVEQVETVFKQGVGYDAPRIFASVRGQVGLH